MRLARTRISFPIIRYTTRVTYCTPRKPTTPEKGLLELVMRFRADSEYGPCTILFLLENLLCFPTADLLALPALENLLSLNVLTFASDRIPVTQVRPVDLTVTEQGKEMYTRGMLPGKSFDETVTHLVDPLRNVVLPQKRESLLLKAPLPVSVGADLAMDLYPRALVQQDLLERPRKWMNPGTEIQSLKYEGKTVLWNASDVDITVSENGELALNTADPDYTAFLNSLDSDRVVTEIVIPALKYSDDHSCLEDLPRKNLHQLQMYGNEIFPLKDAQSHLPMESGSVHFVSYEQESGLQWFRKNMDAMKGSLVVVLSSPESCRASLCDWSQDGKGAVAYVSRPFPDDGCFYFSTAGKNLFAAQVDLEYRGAVCPVLLGYSRSSEHLPAEVHHAMQSVEQALMNSGELEDVLALVFWKDPREVWRHLVEHIDQTTPELDASVAALSVYRERLLSLTKLDAVPDWEEQLQAFLMAGLESIPRPIGLTDFRAFTRAIRIGDLKDLSRVKAVMNSVIELLQPPESFEDHRELLMVLDTLPHQMTEAHYSILYPEWVLKEYFERFKHADFMKLLQDRNCLERSLRSLRQVAGKLQKRSQKCASVNCEEMGQVQPGKDESAPEKLETLATKWHAEWAALEKVLPKAAIIAQGTLPGTINDRLRHRYSTEKHQRHFTPFAGYSQTASH